MNSPADAAATAAATAATIAAAAPVPSPCIDVCRMDVASGLCEGCLRTIAEIAAWAQMPEAGRRAVWAALEQRRAAGAAGVAAAAAVGPGRRAEPSEAGR